MSYTPSSSIAQQTYYSSTPPAPPPKFAQPISPNHGPPLPPPPTGQAQNEPLELDGSQGQHYPQQQYRQGQRSNEQQQQQQLPNIPAIEPGWLPEIVKEKTTADLHSLLNSPELQSALLSNPSTTHPSITNSQSLLPPLLSANLTLCTTLTNLSSHLTTLRSQTQSRLLALRALEQNHRAKLSETEDALAEFSPMALYQRLSASVTEQEALVRGVEESWLEEEGMAGEREVEGWLRRVKEARKAGFLRRERKGRWDEGRVGGWR